DLIVSQWGRMRLCVLDAVVGKFPIATFRRTRKSRALKSVVSPTSSIFVNGLRLTWQENKSFILIDSQRIRYGFVNNWGRCSFRALEIIRRMADYKYFVPNGTKS